MTTPTPADAPAPNVPGCTCNRNDDSWVGEDVPVSVWMCPYHLRRLEALSWATLACMVIDYEAALSPQPEVSVTPGLREAALEYFTALDKERGAHEARLAVGTDFRGLRESRARAEDALRAALVEPPVTPDLRAAAPLLVRICNAMSWYQSGLVTLPGTTASAGIGTVLATADEFAALGALVDAARALASPDTEAKG